MELPRHHRARTSRGVGGLTARLSTDAAVRVVGLPRRLRHERLIVPASDAERYMRTLHVGLRVRDLEQTLAFYDAVGYEVVGRVPKRRSGCSP